MNAELLYTSAPQGLKQGSRGFCTVLSTVGMPLNLATKLESLSGYRHLYPSGTPDASKNPVGFSHLRFMVGGRQISVLSRISDYGLDYSQRTNKLAHHIVVDAPMPACGPAALLAEPGVMRDHWDGQCANIPSPPALPDLSTEPQICRKWEAITGDAGWGGVVADAWLSTSPRPVFIIFAEHQSNELLGLIEESIALLPPSKRWQATFGTYVTTLPPDVDCRVRCVVAGSDEARMASARGTVIDLTIKQSEPRLNNAVDAARMGVIIGSDPNKINNSTQFDEPKNATVQKINEHAQDQNIEMELSLDSEYSLEDPKFNVPPQLNRNLKNQVTLPAQMAGTNANKAKGIQSFIAIGILATSVVAAIFGITIIAKKWNGINIASIDDSTKTIQSNHETKSDNVSEFTKPDSEKNSPDKSSGPSHEQEPTSKKLETKDLSYLEDLVEIRVENSLAKGINPVAIRGNSIVATLTLKKDSELDEQIGIDFELLKSKAVCGLLPDETEASIPLGQNGEANISVSSDFTHDETQIVATGCGLVIKSKMVPVINDAKPEDFSLKMITPKMKDKDAQYLIPGDTICGLLEIKNETPQSHDYLNLLLETSDLVWEIEANGEAKQIQRSKYGEPFVIPNGSKGKSVLLSASIPSTNISLQAKPVAFLDSLSAVAKIDNDFNLSIKVFEPDLFDSDLQPKLGKKSFNDLFGVSDIIAPRDNTDASRFLLHFDKLLSFVREKRSLVNGGLKQFFGVVKNDAKQCGLLSELHVAFEKAEMQDNKNFWLKKDCDERRNVSSVTRRVKGLIDDYDFESPNKTGQELLKVLYGKISSRHQIFAEDTEPERKKKQGVIDSESKFFLWYHTRAMKKDSGYQAFKEGFDKFHDLMKEIEELTDTVYTSPSLIIESPKEDIVVMGGSLPTEYRKMKLPIQVDTSSIVDINFSTLVIKSSQSSDPRRPAAPQSASDQE
jgi:hypothetical protein